MAGFVGTTTKRRTGLRMYEKKLIFLLDILGFRKLIMSDPTIQELERVRGILEEWSYNTQSSRTDFQMTVLSDAFIVSTNSTVASLANGLFSTQGLWWAYLSKLQLPLRGVIHVGEIWHRGNVVFGPGLIEAHCLEQKVAKFPRIIFSESVNELLQELNNKEFKFYEKDYDGKYFVNVFSEPLWRSGYEKQTGMAFGSNLQLCENVVKGRQKTEDQGIEEKWCWLQEKWARAASD